MILKVVNEQKPREIAGQVLLRWSAGTEYVENLLEQSLSSSRLSGPDRGLCQELVYGVARWHTTLDWLIDLKAPDRQQKPMLQVLLRMGLYQIFWLDRIPNHAAVNETVEHAKRAGFGPQAGFINAVLRNFLREFDETKASLEELKTSQPHLGHAHPEWLVKRWTERYGAANAARLMEWNNTPARVFARINTLMFAGRSGATLPPGSMGHGVRRPFVDRTFKDAGDVLLQWRDEGVEYDFVRRDWIEDNLVFEFKSHPPISKLASFQLGLFYIQDPSTLAAVAELDPQPGETVLDLCAAPGGKTTFIAQLMENRGRVLAHDPSPERLKLVQENCARLGVTCVEIVRSMQSLDPALKFDRILLDAPCSNTGVMRRRVDLRWRIQPAELTRLRTTQMDLLQKAGRSLKPGGTLIYSTCSLEPEENGTLIEEFLAREPRFTCDYQRELQPFRDGCDGAYVASLALQG